MSKVYTNIVNVINSDNDTIIKGFICKPEMIVVSGESGLGVITRFRFDEKHNELYALYVYEFINNVWKGRWMRFKLDLTDDLLDELHDVVKDIIAAREEALLQAEWEAACKEASEYPEDDLLAIDECLEFTDVIPGEKCNNGGEYGFYSSYYPTERKGVYEYYTRCTCDFDPCGTGREGFVVLTKENYKSLIEAEDALYEEGCLY